MSFLGGIGDKKYPSLGGLGLNYSVLENAFLQFMLVYHLDGTFMRLKLFNATAIHTFNGM